MRWFAALAFLLWGAGAAAADPVRVYAAGSLAAVMPKLIAAAGLGPDAVTTVFGPAGVLGQRLLAGEQADLFASADLKQPEKVVAAHEGALVVPFARNRMCVASPSRLGLTRENLLDRLLAPDLRLATSTPGADPGGDYASAVFARADALRPGAGSILAGKALLLLGGPGSMTPQPGKSPAATIFLGDHADALLYYCSGSAATLGEVPGLLSFPVPDALEVHPVYGMAVLSARPEAARLALFILSQQGQQMLAAAGLLPILPG